MTTSGYRASSWVDENILELDSSNSCITVNIPNPTKLYTSKSYVNFRVYKLYFSFFQ
jgi:hypothetical protein